MAWRDQYRQASFRGVPFFVRDASLSGGRRTVQHEYPDRDKPYPEDMGRAARSYPVEGYVLGADYMEARDALLDALEAGGSGELIHPYHGAKSVNVDTFDVREGSADGGMARFSITFLEGGEDRHPSSERDFLASVDARATALTDTSQANFIERFDIAGLPAFVSAAAEGLITDLSGTLEELAEPLLSGAEAAASFARDVLALRDDAAALVQSPMDLASRIVSLFGRVSSPSSSGNPRRNTNVLQLLADWGSEKASIPRTTSTRAQQDDNQAALINLVRQVATAQAVTTATRTEWPTHDDAVDTRETLAERLDVIMESTESDPLYLDAQALRSELVQALPSPEQSLPRLSSFTPNATLPALVLAYQLHGDAARADEITARNRVRHPGFVPGGDPLEILNRG